MDKLEKVKTLILSGKYNDALKYFELLIRDPECGLNALGHRAYLYRSIGRFEEAINDYEEIVKKNPADLDALALLADTRLLIGQTDKAIIESIKVLQKNPMHTRALQVLINYHQALGLMETSQTSEPNYDKIQPSKPINPVIDLLERDPNSYPASVYPEIGRFLYSFVRCYRPKLVLETGSYVGYSSLCIAQALEENKIGYLHSFDLFLDLPDYKSPVIGPCSNTLEVARAHINKAELSNRVTFYKGDSSETIKKVFKDNLKCFNLAFIDGDHTLRGCLKDWLVIDQLLVEEGVVLLHDTMPEKCGWLGPRYLLEELGKKESSNYHWVNIPTPDGFGLGIIQKKSKNDSKKWWPPLTKLFTEWLFHRRLIRISKNHERINEK